MSEGYMDIVERVREGFAEIESDILVDLRKNDKEYAALLNQIDEMEEQCPFLFELVEGSGEMTISSEEHDMLVKYLARCSRRETLERRQIYFRGHTDGYAYLREIGVVYSEKIFE